MLQIRRVRGRSFIDESRLKLFEEMEKSRCTLPAYLHESSYEGYHMIHLAGIQSGWREINLLLVVLQELQLVIEAIREP
jgi:hypothetical protein